MLITPSDLFKDFGKHKFPPKELIVRKCCLEPVMKNYQTFKKQYILIEDGKNKHQPFYKEYVVGDPPRLYLDSLALCCPFQVNKRKRHSSNKRRHTREGFCEVCYLKFNNYDNHIMTFEHREFAKDNNNYKKLDTFISSFVSEDSWDLDEDAQLSPTLKMTPMPGGRKGSMPGYVTGEKYGWTLHFSKVSTDDDCGQEVVSFDRFVMEVLDK